LAKPEAECAICREKFRPRNFLQVTCSLECRRAYNQAYQRRYRASPAGRAARRAYESTPDFFRAEKARRSSPAYVLWRQQYLLRRKGDRP